MGPHVRPHIPGASKGYTRRLQDSFERAGTIRGPDGPVDSGDITIYSGLEVITAAIETDGTFQVDGVAPFSVLMWAEVPGLAVTYYPHHDRPQEWVDLDTDAVLDMELPAESRVLGRLSGEGELDRASIVVYNSDRSVGTSGEVAADGSFDIGGFHLGEYTMQVFGSDSGLVSAEYVDDEGRTQVIELAAGEPSDLGEVLMDPAALVHGRVLDSSTGSPVYGAYVYIEGQSTAARYVGTSDVEGQFALHALAGDVWKVWIEYVPVCPNDASWVDLYFPDQVNPAFAGAVDVLSGSDLRWDAVLAPDHDQDAMGDDWETAFQLDTTRNDAFGDPDEDGFLNVEEYLLGTDPQTGRRGCVLGGAGSAALVLLLPVGWLRRRPTL